MLFQYNAHANDVNSNSVFLKYFSTIDKFWLPNHLQVLEFRQNLLDSSKSGPYLGDIYNTL